MSRDPFYFYFNPFIEVTNGGGNDQVDPHAGSPTSGHLTAGHGWVHHARYRTNR